VKNASVALLLFAVWIFSGVVFDYFGKDEPEPQPRRPVNTYVMEFDMADHVGEMGKLYVVRAEWVYLSAESAEEKREELNAD